jgi:hypothetical protein
LSKIAPNLPKIKNIMKKGIIVRSTGKGKTKSWGNYIGKVTKVQGNSVFVIWENTSFEDEMKMEEVEKFKISEKVTKLKFSDGMIIHSHGPLRTVEFSDGWYVVGKGMVIPVASELSGKEVINKFNSDNS